MSEKQTITSTLTKPMLRVKQWLNILSISRLIRWTIYGFIAWAIYKNYHKDLLPAELIPKYSFSDSKFVKMDGMNVHYRVTGKGEPILLLHNNNSSLHTWTHWTESLSQKYQVISVDLPGNGLTGPHPRGSYSAFMYGGFLEKFVQELDLKSFHLVGNGLGAQIAWFYASEHPEQIKKLVLLDAPGFEEKSTDWLKVVARTPVINRVIWKITPRSFFKIMLEERFADDKSVTDSLINRHFELFLRQGNRKAFTDMAQVTENKPPADFIEKITAPTLILWGAEDANISPEFAYQFHKKIKGSYLKIYENTGHCPQEENPHQTVKDVMDFLEGKF